jgi:orotate phosphoribosyltransferase
MAEFGHLEHLVIGLHARGELGYANTPEEFIKLKSGRLSPNFFNGRGIMSFSDKIDMSITEQMRLAKLAAEGYAHGIDQVKNGFDHIINLPQAVNPIVGAVALLSGASLLYLRTPEGEKGYGKHQPIEGVFSKGDIVTGIDNVISNGDTKKEVTEPIEGAGLVLPEFVVLLDREEGGEAALKDAGYDLTKVIGMRAATQILLDAGRIRSEQAEWSFDYIDEYNIPVSS